MKIPLTQGKFATVSSEDYKYLMQWKWAYNGIYAIRGRTTATEKFTVYMHRGILVRMGNYVFANTDHINRNTLDNRRCNLRPATASQNAHNRGKRSSNTSGYIGVSWSKDCKKWEAQSTTSGEYTHLGYFDDPKDAARTYNKASLK